MIRWALSVDFGSSADSTAICAIRRKVIPTGETTRRAERGMLYPYEMYSREEDVLRSELHLGYMRALHPPVDYEAVARGLVDRLQMLEPYREPMFGEEPTSIALVIDAVGVGRGVLPMIERELRDTSRGQLAPVSLWCVQSGGGNRVTRSGRFFNVPKRQLITSAYTELRTGRLLLGPERPGVEVDGLTGELVAYQQKFNQRGHDLYEPSTSTLHDDRVDALALNTWFWSYPPLSATPREIGVAA